MPDGRSALWWLLLGGSLACGRSRVEGSTNVAATEENRPPLGVVCTETCNRYEACSSVNAADQDASPVPFVFDCSPACRSATEPASLDATRLLDCVRLADCNAFLACMGVTDSAPVSDEPAAEGYVAATTDRCRQVCSRAHACRPQDHDVDACIAICQAPARDEESRARVLACANQPTCDALLPCLAAPTSDETGAGALGLDPLCATLCDRTLTCGADKAELDAHQLRALSRETDDAWMECAIQCGQELRDDNRSDFDKCVAVQDCEKFLSCADEL